MAHSLKSLILCSCLFAGFFIAADFNKVEAAHGRWGAYNNERAAWGGNGGSWGGSNWYGYYGPPQDNYYTGGYYSSPYYYSNGYDNNYYFDNSYPYGQHYNSPGIGADAGVDGAGIYFNIR